MALSKKHYVAIAKIIRNERLQSQESVVCLTDELADYFKQDNPRFDRDRFMEACEP